MINLRQQIVHGQPPAPPSGGHGAAPLLKQQASCIQQQQQQQQQQQGHAPPRTVARHCRWSATAPARPPQPWLMTTKRALAAALGAWWCAPSPVLGLDVQSSSSGGGGGLLSWLPGRGPSPCDFTSNPGLMHNPGVAWAVNPADKQLTYPAWLEGTWQVAASFGQVQFPQGQQLLSRAVPGVLKNSMVAALPDVGAAMSGPLRYQQRFLDSPREGGVVADRAFNIKQKMDAFLGYEAVRRVEYDPQTNPTRLAVVFGTPRRDTSQISQDLRKAELFVNNRAACGGGGGGAFTCFELFRQVTQARQQGDVGDYLVLESWTPDGGNPAAVVHTRQWVLAFLQPQDPQYFKAGDLPVAVYEYTYAYTRVAA